MEPPDVVRIRPAVTLSDIVEKLKRPEVQAELETRFARIDDLAKRATFEIVEELEGARDVLIDVLAGTDEGKSILDQFVGDFLGIDRG